VGLVEEACSMVDSIPRRGPQEVFVIHMKKKNKTSSATSAKKKTARTRAVRLGALAAKLKRTRTSKSLSRLAIARDMKLSSMTVARVESGGTYTEKTGEKIQHWLDANV
jgi:hypothetical protein